MHKIGRIKVTTAIPALLGLKDLSCNLWWTWNSEAIDLFRDIDLVLWESLTAILCGFSSRSAPGNLRKS